jgi:hypothetical protein
MTSVQDREDDEFADDKAGELIDDVLDSRLGRRFLWALDRLGWRIALQDPRPGEGDRRWPVPSWDKRKKWPAWIDTDYLKPKPKPTLRPIDGGKKDDCVHDTTHHNERTQ